MPPKRAREQRRINREDEQDLNDIATAVLLGCTFWENSAGLWWVHDKNDDLHPMEHRTCNGWQNKADLARDYIRWAITEA